MSPTNPSSWRSTCSSPSWASFASHHSFWSFHVFQIAVQHHLSFLWLDGHCVTLEEECWSKTLIYGVKCILTFLLLRYCQGAMVIRQQIQFSLSCLRHSSISVYYQAMSNRQLHLLCFMYPCKIQLCRICRWLKTSCSRANKSDSGQRYVHRCTYVGVYLKWFFCVSKCLTSILVTK